MNLVVVRNELKLSCSCSCSCVEVILLYQYQYQLKQHGRSDHNWEEQELLLHALHHTVCTMPTC
jgi:hypothetical protein